MLRIRTSDEFEVLLMGPQRNVVRNRVPKLKMCRTSAVARGAAIHAAEAIVDARALGKLDVWGGHDTECSSVGLFRSAVQPVGSLVGP